MLEETCSICLSPLHSYPTILLACSHVFHDNCFTDWKRVKGYRECPLCKEIFSENSPINIVNTIPVREFKKLRIIITIVGSLISCVLFLIMIPLFFPNLILFNSTTV